MMNKILELIEDYKNLNEKYEDLSHPQKLDTLKNLVECLNNNQKSILIVKNEPQVKDILLFLLHQLHKLTAREIAKKLFTRCINILTKQPTLNFDKCVQSNLIEFLNNDDISIQQKLFIVNVYLENLDRLGLNSMNNVRFEFSQFAAFWLDKLTNELKETNTPIVISKLIADLQLYFKTVINFIQKCLSTQRNEPQVEENIEKINHDIVILLDVKEKFSLELAYSASMAQILINSLKSEYFMHELIDNCLRKYENNNRAIELRDLCFFQALLTMMKANQIINDNLLASYKNMLSCMLNSIFEFNNLHHSIAMTRAINFWIIKLIELLNVNREATVNELSKNDANLDWFSKLILFVWSNFDNNIDVIKNTNLQSYKMLLRAAASMKGEPDEVALFYDEEVNRCMRLSWHSNAKLNALIILLEFGLNVNKLLQFNDMIARELINCITERSAAYLVADLYSQLFKLHYDQIKSSQRDDVDALKAWSLLWWPPVLECLESNDKTKKTFTYEYLMPKIIRSCPEGVAYCQRWSNTYASTIICSKLTRSLGLSDAEDDLNETILEKTLVHCDDQIRLDSLALICENLKTTETICDTEFQLLKKFLYFNGDCASASFRQIVIACLKKLFIRLRESWLFEIRQLNKAVNEQRLKSSETATFDVVHIRYGNFISWLFEFLFNSIHLDSTFAKRNQSLLILTTFLDIIGSRCSSSLATSDHEDTVLFDYIKCISRDRLLTLIECLWDTYANNKDLALQLLLKLDKSHFRLNGIIIEDYFSIAIKLLNSRRPIDSMTSVYLIVFIQNKSDLKNFNINLEHFKSLNLYLVNSVIDELKSHKKLANENLLLASLEKPIYGPLSAIRNLIIHSIDEIKNVAYLNEWKRLIGELVQICFDISVIVSPIVNSSSPEGIFPSELISMQPEAAEKIKSVTPQMLLVCCWRTMKEISLFFGDLIVNLPIEFETTISDSVTMSPLYLLSYDQVSQIGNYFVQLLLDARHLGVFEQTYLGFTNMCQTFWKSKSKIYNEQPTKWLERVLDSIQQDEARMKLCSTRRGGGLPCFVQAIVSTEPADNGRKSLSKSMHALLQLAEVNHKNEDDNFTKVLSMYILTALFKDYRIGENVLEYAERALIVAINGFDSINWNVRNSSTLLFSSLMNRIFGVNRSKDEISKKNTMPGRMFFSKFSKLYQLFTDVISTSIESMNTNLNAKLYLVLLILCHLFTLGDESSDPEALLHNYVPLLLKCANSPVMKIRKYMVKAVLSIVNIERYTHLVREIFTDHFECVTLERSLVDHNKIHGLLLVLNGLVDKYDIFKYVQFDHFAKNIVKISNLKHCTINYSALLDLIFKINRSILLGPESERSSRSAKWLELTVTVQLNALSTLNTNSDVKILLPPATHDLMTSIGQILCILTHHYPEISSVLSLYERIELACRSNLEYSMNLMKGVALFYKNRFTNDHQTVRLDIIRLFRPYAFEALFKWNELDNNLNLKTACELLTEFVRDARQNEQTMKTLFESDEILKDFWQKLNHCCQHQLETETRLSVLNLINVTLGLVYNKLSYDDFGFDCFVDNLESYLDKREEACCVSNLFNANCGLLFGRNIQFGHHSMKLWDLLFQLLVENEEKSCETACDTVSKIVNIHSDSPTAVKLNTNHFRQTSSAMIKTALELFMNTYGSTYPNETAKFLVEQYVMVSECDSSPNDNEEELETVFDKGVDCLNISIIIYLEQVLVDLIHLLNDRNVARASGAYLNEQYALICQRLEREMTFTCANLNECTMNYNDIRFTKIACNLSFVHKLRPYVDDSNQLKSANINQRYFRNFTHSSFSSFLVNYIKQAND